MKKWGWMFGIIGVFLIVFGFYKLMNSRTIQMYGKLVHHVEVESKVVFLTFDDGPNDNTTAILELLSQYDVKANFFLLGKNIEKYKDEARNIVEAGHLVGNHSYSHPRMIFKSTEIIDQEIQKTNELIRDLGYQNEIFFRPPNGKKLLLLPKYLKDQNITTVMWGIEPESFIHNKYHSVMLNYVLEKTKPGSIILLHPMNAKDHNGLDLVEEVIIELKENGYEFGVLTDYISK